MDPADTRQALTAHSTMLGSHEQQLSDHEQQLGDHHRLLTALSHEIVAVAQRLDQPAPPLPSGSGAPATRASVVVDSPMCNPEPLTATSTGVEVSCFSAGSFFQRVCMFPSDAAKINYLIGLLQGRVLEWVHASCARSHVNTLLLETFMQHFKLMFNRPNCAGFAAELLFTLRQGLHSVADYVVEFGILAVEAGWDKLALQAAFSRGLGEQVRDALFAGAQPANLNGLIDRD